jgi:hypothetical protein
MKYILVGMSMKYSDEMEVNQLVGKLSQKIKIQRMNFGFGEGICVIHFETQVRFDKLKMEVSSVMSSESPIHFLLKNDSKTALISLPDSYSGILDLDKTIGGVCMTEKKSDLKNFLELLREINQDNCIIDFEPTELGEEDLYIPTLDELLDKICQCGYDSLSLYEREVLNTYSKN